MAAKAIKFIPANKKLIQTKISANIRYDNVSLLPACTTIAKELGLQNYYYFTLNGSNQQDTAKLNTVKTFIQAVGASASMLYPVQYKEINDQFPRWLDTIVSTLNPVYIGGDAETISIKKDGITMTNAEYIDRIQKVIAHIPNIPVVWDAGLMYREDVLDQRLRNEAIAAVAGIKQLRQYKQLSDLCSFSKDQAKNYTALRNYYDVTFPDLQKKLQDRFGAGSKEGAMQYHEEDTGLANLSDALSNYSKGEMARSILSNTEYYSTLCWMALNNLITRDNKLEPSGISIKRIAQAFKYKYVMPIETTLTGCRMIGTWDGSENYGILATNDSSSEYKIKASDIKIHNKIISGIMVRDSGFADSWTAPIKNEDDIADIETVIRKFSTNFITFKAIASAVADS